MNSVANTVFVRVPISLHSKELKDAITQYAAANGKDVYRVIEETWKAMLSSTDYTIRVNTVYDKSIETGLAATENQKQRRFDLNMNPDLTTQVDDAIEDEKRKGVKKINRSIFTQEAIRRYIEPALIQSGYLKESVFKDYKKAAKNLRALRDMLGTQQDFYKKFFIINGVNLISYSQYAFIERGAGGNIEKVIELVSDALNISKEAFFMEPLEFQDYLKSINISKSAL